MSDSSASPSRTSPENATEDGFVIPTPRVRPLREKLGSRRKSGGASSVTQDDIVAAEEEAKQAAIASTVSAMCLLRGKAFEALERRAHAQRWYLRALQTDVTNVEAFSCLVDSKMLKAAEERYAFSLLKFRESEQWLKPFYQAKLQHNGLSAEEIDELINSNPGLVSNVDLLACKAKNWYRRNEFRKCYEVTKKLMQDDPFLHPVLALHITVMRQLSLTSELFSCAHRLVDMAPDSAVTWFAVATYYLLVEKFDHARQFFNKATDIDPNFGEAWVGLGNAFSGLKESDQAMTAYRAAHRIMPGSHLPPLMVAIEYNKLRNPRNAKIFLKEAQLARKDDPLVENELGSACVDTGDLEAAEQHYRRALELAKNQPQEPWAATLSNLANTLRRRGKFEEAIEVYNRTLVICKKKASIHLAIGMCYHSVDNLDKAIDAYHKASSLDPENTMITQALDKAMETAAKLPCTLLDYR